MAANFTKDDIGKPIIWANLLTYTSTFTTSTSDTEYIQFNITIPNINLKPKLFNRFNEILED